MEFEYCRIEFTYIVYEIAGVSSDSQQLAILIRRVITAKTLPDSH
jgi:hypothetical protein